MRQLRYVDFDCANCGSICTRLVYFDTDLRRPCDDDTQYCEEEIYSNLTEAGVPCWSACGAELTPREMNGIGYMKTIVKGNGDFCERERARLEKRGDDHWRRQGRDEAIDRERAFLKKQGVAGGVK